MADKKSATKSSSSPAKRYFYTTKRVGLRVALTDTVEEARESKDSTKLRHEQFVVYNDVDRNGDRFRYGLLATSNPDVVKVLEDDAAVQKVSKDEFDKLSDLDRKGSKASREPQVVE